MEAAMSERLTQVTVIRKDVAKYGDLQLGQMSPVKDSTKPDLWIIACPQCNSLGELRVHSVIEHEDGTVTVSPSIVCNGSIYDSSQVEPTLMYRPCKAHYFVEHNQIKWV